MELTNQNLNRPWQGTVLGVVNILGLAMSGVMLMILFFGGSFLAEYIQDSQLSMIFGIGTIFILIFIIPFVILGIFVTIGTFKGQKWAVIVMLIFTAMALFGALSSLFTADGYNAFGSLVINGFILYCVIVSLKDPFYK